VGVGRGAAARYAGGGAPAMPSSSSSFGS
jgi:hypothetical protein